MTCLTCGAATCCEDRRACCTCGTSRAEERARAVVAHWREQAERNRQEQAHIDSLSRISDSRDAPTARFYVPADEALDRAADRLEAALDGRDFE